MRKAGWATAHPAGLSHLLRLGAKLCEWLCLTAVAIGCHDCIATRQTALPRLQRSVLVKIISNLAGNAVGLCVVASILSGCSNGSGSAPIPIPAAQTHVSAASPQFVSNPANPEFLTGKAKLRFGKKGTTFTAHGTAAGSYPGTFTASGSWDSGESNGGHGQWICCPWWSFSEAFTITSGSSSISGTITGFGIDGGVPFSYNVVSNLDLPYRASIGSGNANIETIQKGDFSEVLAGL
jgi:hypothetical protein